MSNLSAVQSTPTSLNNAVLGGNRVPPQSGLGTSGDHRFTNIPSMQGYQSLPNLNNASSTIVGQGQSLGDPRFNLPPEVIKPGTLGEVGFTIPGGAGTIRLTPNVGADNATVNGSTNDGNILNISVQRGGTTVGIRGTVSPTSESNQQTTDARISISQEIRAGSNQITAGASINTASGGSVGARVEIKNGSGTETTIGVGNLNGNPNVNGGSPTLTAGIKQTAGNINLEFTGSVSRGDTRLGGQIGFTF